MPSLRSSELAQACWLQCPGLEAGHVEEFVRGEAGRVDGPTERFVSVGGDVLLECEVALFDTNRSWGENLRGEGGGKVGEGESLGADEYLAGQVVVCFDERLHVAYGTCKDKVGNGFGSVGGCAAAEGAIDILGREVE